MEKKFNISKSTLNENIEMIKTEEEWNEKILKITIKIKEQYSELGNYLEEMPVTIPNKKYPEITLLSLKQYFESLDSLLKNYIMEQDSKT